MLRFSSFSFFFLSFVDWTNSKNEIVAFQFYVQCVYIALNFINDNHVEREFKQNENEL